MVVPDYYARYPKPCAGGWGRLAINVSPSGKAMPCHAAETIPGLEFWNVRDRSLAEIWRRQPGLQRLSRNGLDARTLPFLRPTRDRLGRLPLPGAGADRRRRARPIRPARKSPLHAEIERTAAAEAEAGSGAIRWRSCKDTVEA